MKRELTGKLIWLTADFLVGLHVSRLMMFFVCLIMQVQMINPEQLSAIDVNRIIVRNDLTPLVVDLEKGRFGTGKLYFDDPIDLVVDEDSRLYVLDAGNYRIQVINDRGRYLEEWDLKGEEDVPFDEPVAMSISPNNDFLLVLDKETYRVTKFDLEGEKLLSFGTEGSRKGMFELPIDLTVDTLGYIYVLDHDRKVVLKFHESGAFIEEWGNKGRVGDRLEAPVSIAYSDELTGYVYVLDAGKVALIKYNRDGDLEETINLTPDVLEEGMHPLKVEVNDENEIFVLDGLHGKLVQLNRRGISVFQLTSNDLVIEQPAGFVIDEENRVYVSDLKKNRFFRFPLELN